MSKLLVKSVAHMTGHILAIEFNDGKNTVVDFSRFIFSDGHPDYEPYKNITRFLNYNIVDGNINWDDYTMIFPVEDLYQNKLIKS